MSKNNTRVLLFDMGGVLCRLNDPIETFGLRSSHAEFMQTWLMSPAVRDFESGAIDVDEFAANIVREADLNYDADEFLRRFHAWPDGLYPGTQELLDSIPQRYELAVLSNTNALHWDRADIGGALKDFFGKIFLSFETGLLKPDLQAFEHVLTEFDCDPLQILFFDDNPLNVTAAQNAGLDAIVIHTINDLHRAVDEYGILR
jgi:HAD superfamily hydrolase (TIGR01509 family)